MAEPTPFLSEIRLFSFAQAPMGWAQCNGQFLPINQNQALFALLGTTYGGNGQTTFALPDLRSRVPMHFGNNHNLGERAGAETATLTQQEMPAHLHSARAQTEQVPADFGPQDAAGKVLAGASVALQGGNQAAVQLYTSQTQSQSLVAMHPQAVSTVGGSQAHNNMKPYLTLNFCIALQGIFPSQN